MSGPRQWEKERVRERMKKRLPSKHKCMLSTTRRRQYFVIQTLTLFSVQTPSIWTKKDESPHKRIWEEIRAGRNQGMYPILPEDLPWWSNEVLCNGRAVGIDICAAGLCSREQRKVFPVFQARPHCEMDRSSKWNELSNELALKPSNRAWNVCHSTCPRLQNMTYKTVTRVLHHTSRARRTVT